MRDRELTEQRPPGRCKAQPDLAFVFGPRTPLDHAGALEPVYQLHSAVMLQEHPRCDLANRRLGALGKAVHRKQKLMLLRLDPVFFRRGFAEMEKSAYLPAKFSEVAILRER